MKRKKKVLVSSFTRSPHLDWGLDEYDVIKKHLNMGFGLVLFEKFLLVDDHSMLIMVVGYRSIGGLWMMF